MSAVERLHAYPFWQETLLAGLLVGLLAGAAVVDPAFIGIPAQLELSSHIWEMAILTIPMTLIIITGGIDLSVGSTMALSAVVLGLAYEAKWPLYEASILALLVGVVAGALNGWFIATVRVHPLIVTLATMAAYRGFAEGISQARPISGFPDSFGVLGRSGVGGVPFGGLIFAAVALVAWVLLAWTTTGRSLYAVGHNQTAARYSGIRVDRLKLLLYTLSGAACALAAILFVSRRNTAKADVGDGMELDVITAVVLGGASIFGGRGRVLGTVLGVALIHEVREFVGWHWDRSELHLVVMGTLLIGSVLLNRAVAGPKANNS